MDPAARRDTPPSAMPAGRELPAVTKNKNYPQPVKQLKPSALRPAEALRLYQELLPDQVRVLGSDHPDALSIQSRIQQLSKSSYDG